jgi:hypothetical protein
MMNSTASQRTVRLLMALWDGALSQGTLIKKVKKSGEVSKDYQSIVEQLIQDGAVTRSGEKRSVRILLLEHGKQLLGNLLRDPKFKFDGQIGKPAANVLLNVMRSQAADPVGSPAAVESIHSYEVFKTIALETFDRLNQDFNMDNLVPIYRIRRAIGDRVSRKDFDSWLLELQATDIFQLLEGSVEDSALDKIEDSISTRVSGLRCYAKRLDA